MNHFRTPLSIVAAVCLVSALVLTVNGSNLEPRYEQSTGCIVQTAPDGAMYPAPAPNCIDACRATKNQWACCARETKDTPYSDAKCYCCPEQADCKYYATLEDVKNCVKPSLPFPY